MDIRVADDLDGKDGGDAPGGGHDAREAHAEGDEHDDDLCGEDGWEEAEHYCFGCVHRVY